MGKKKIMTCLVLFAAILILPGLALAEEALQIKNMSDKVFSLQYVTCEGARMGALECTYTPGAPTAQFGSTVKEGAQMSINGHALGAMDPETFERAKYYFGFMIKLQKNATQSFQVKHGNVTKYNGRATVSRIPDIQGKKAWKIEISMN